MFKKIIEKARQYILKNEKKLLRIEKLIKYLYFWIFWTFILISIINILIPFFVSLNDTKTTENTQISELYKNQLYASDFNKFYNENKWYIVKVLFPADENINFFQVLKRNKETKELETYEVYKLMWEKWDKFEIDIKSINNENNNKYWIWLYYANKSNFDIAWAINALFSLLFIWFFLYMISKTMWIWTKSPLTLFLPDDKNKISFDDIWWLESHKEELIEIIETLKKLKKFKERWVRSIRWILFYWPPWTGKTLLAKTIASQVWAEIFIASANNFGSKYINEWPQKVTKAFKEIEDFIKKNKREFSILFIDELDSILKERWSWHSEDDKVVNAFLDRIDWIEWSKNIILIGATNNINSIDAASLSRFDRKIWFKLPTSNERIDIIKKILKKRLENDPLLEISDDLDYDILSGNTEWMSWRDIESFLNEVHRHCVLHNIKVDNVLVQNKFMDFILWKENKSITFSEQDLKVVTYHELWHAFIWYINWDNVHTVTIVPRWNSLWSAWILPNIDRNLNTENDMLLKIQWLIAWRIAEQVFLWEITTGSSNDYERATAIARSYFTDFNFKYKDFQVWYLINRNNNPNNPLIDNTIFSEVNKNISIMIKDQEQIVLDYLTKYKEQFTELYNLLVENKTIYKKDFISIFKDIIK